MSDLDTRFHETWLGLVQPVEGLVVSLPVLVEAQCMQRHPPSLQQTFLEVCPLLEPPKPSAPKDAPSGPRHLADRAAFLEAVLGWTPDLYETGDALPPDLPLYVPEGKQTLRPTLALKRPAEREDDHLYGGLLTVLLRLVFVLYAEDRGLLPVETRSYAESFSVLALFEQLQQDHGA